MFEEYHGNQRDKIPWYPTINYDIRINWGTFVKYSKLDVYNIVKEKGKEKTIVANPNNCIVFCKGCEGQCPISAITFPSKQKTRKITSRQ